MESGVLVDTSFLISLVKPVEANHAAAVSYYKACIERQVPMYLSTIAASEFAMRQSVLDLELRNFIVLPFNIDHAMKAGLIAQCACEGIGHVLTGDERTLAKHLRQLTSSGATQTRPVLLAKGFDEAWFNNGQPGLLPS